MRFVDIKNDIAFRKIFGNEKKKIILISFLNAVMRLKGEDVIDDVEILNTYQLPIIKNLKASIIDIKARDQTGKTHLVEMQVSEPDGLDKRLLYYASKEYSQQIDTGDDYTKLKPVIFIGIFDFKFTKGDKYLSHHAVCDVENGEQRIRDMDFYFIELPKFTKSLSELTGVTDKWIFFLKEVENLDVIPDNVDDEGLAAAYQDASRYTWTKEELNAYSYAAMREQDERGKMTLAIRRAEEQGMEKGMENIIKKLHEKGKSVEEIAELLDLSMEEVERTVENQP
ncbi:MAG: Rpn family recombination-promoting nuclease/putative transposase [Saprospiraceae bacterium]